MSVLALVRKAEQAKLVITWATRFAVAQSAELLVFYWPESGSEQQGILPHDEEGAIDPALAAVRNAIESVVRAGYARTEGISRHLVSVLRIPATELPSGTVKRIRSEDPTLVVAADTVDPGGDGQRPVRKLLSQVPCDKLILSGAGGRSVQTDEIIVGTSEGSNDKAAVALGASVLAATKGTLTVFGVEAPVGHEAIDVGERSIRSMLRELEIEEGDNLSVRVELGDDTISTTAAVADGQDLLLVGADNAAYVPQLLELTNKPAIGVVYKAPQFRFRKGRDSSRTLLPRINPADYADLYEMLQTGSRWNTDFMMMLMLASGIATLGLIENSPAVVTGSMLLAPLMTPMIGMGLALNQGNAKLARTCLRSIGFGFLVTLAVSFVLGWLTPGAELAPQILARTEPNILDLVLALFSGTAAAYALARPGLVGTVAGVAIAVALVPPLCSAGILLAFDRVSDAIGATSLLAANLVGIILAAAFTFRLMGLLGSAEPGQRNLWVRRVVVALAIGALAIALPLTSTLFHEIHEGYMSPIAYPVTAELKNAVKAHVESHPGRTLLLIERPGYFDDPFDVSIVVSSRSPVPPSYADELTAVVRREMASPDARVRVECVTSAWMNTTQQ